MTLYDKVIACRMYKGMSRNVTCEMLGLSRKELIAIEQVVFRKTNTASGINPRMEKDSGDDIDASTAPATFELA